MRMCIHLLLQLDLITDLLGTPCLEDMRTACEGAKTHILRSAHKPPSLAALYNLSSQASHEAVHLLCRMLVFDPVSGKRVFKKKPVVSQWNKENRLQGLWRGKYHA